MSKKANPKLIGGFVLGAVVLLVAAVVILGSGRLVDNRAKAVVFFDGSVNGLSVGAPVSLRGVKIGEVTQVKIEIDIQQFRARIPVYIAFEPGRAELIGNDGQHFGTTLEEAVKRGLRAQLQMQSIVTGQLFVELDFMPNTPIRLIGSDKSMPEIPAVETMLDTLKNELSKLPLQDIGHTALKVLTSLDGLLSSPETRQMMLDLAASSSELRGTLVDVRTQVKPVGDNLSRASASAADAMREMQVVVRDLKVELGATLDQLKRTMKVYETQGDAVGKDLQRSLRTVEKALKDADTALIGINTVFGEGTSSRADIDQILRNLASTTRALRGLAETLERNPNALITGRK